MNPNTYLLFLLLINVAGAAYKQWVPNTNFENASNWDKNRVPCVGGTIVFENDKKLSVLVQSMHSITEMYIPWDGEFILASGSGFAAYTTHSSSDPGCETGSITTFRDADSYQWLDPTLWHTASSIDDLESGNYLFSVHEESVPCQYDDVIFPTGNSFRVNIQSSNQMTELKSISLMGQKFTRDADFARYMQSNTAKQQFHGQGSLKVTNTKCSDQTGCSCGNSGDHENICSALLQHSENECPGVVCMYPLRPVGHCCDICGESFGIVRGKMQVATGINSSQSSGRRTVVNITASVFGVLCLLLVGTTIFLLKARIKRFWKRNSDLEPFGETFDKGFDNPMYDTPGYAPADVPGLYSEDALRASTVKRSGIYFINPLFDEDECTI
uniref:Protein amnionless n=1 Tax=Geotrypetes seraphini TaxID=260995 RepID=A0A6P8RUI3_GEOSA|nr:protein amnionless isoform X3 [Geotrypetes seraphini]